MVHLDQQPAWLREAIEIGKQFDFKKKSKWRHNLRNLSWLALLLAIIVTVVLGNSLLRPAIYLPLAVVIMGFLMMSLFVLVVHESSHNMFLIGSSPQATYRWNQIAGWAICILFGVNYRKHWEEGHIAHHFDPVSSQDPMICNPRIGREFLKHALKVLLIPCFIQTMGPLRGGGAEYDCAPVKKYGFNVAGVWMTLFWTCLVVVSWPYFWVHWPAALAIFMGTQTLAFFTLLKTAVEHGGQLAKEKNPYLRQLTSVYRFRFLFLPFKISYHLEHHLNYHVPWYDLDKYHRLLRSMLPEEIQAYFYNRDFWGQMRGTREAFTKNI